MDVLICMGDSYTLGHVALRRLAWVMDSDMDSGMDWDAVVNIMVIDRGRGRGRITIVAADTLAVEGEKKNQNPLK